MIESRKIKNPFPGLRPFEIEEYRLFFGREGQSDALVSRLQHSHFLAVVGTSGSGKSSLVRAGLLPALRGGMMNGAGAGWRICIMRPGSDPIANLARALADKEVLLEAGAGLPPAETEAIIEATLRRGSLGLSEVARQARLAEHEKLLVVVDQFEELFRFRAARASSSTGDDASAFVKLLLEAAQQREFSIYVVPTMRSDFLGDCAQFQGLPEAINDGQYLIPRLTRDERRFAITGPVGVTRGKITEPLVNRLMNDVGDSPDQLPILQHALMRTWDYWAAHRRNGEPIGLEDYEAVGTMSDALSKHADEAFDDLPDKRSELIAEILFKALTERGSDNREIRRPTCLKDICEIANASAPEVSAVIEIFRAPGRSFLMPPAGVPLEPETVIDISHESLIRNWKRLMHWVKDEAESARTYRRLAGAATDYHQGAGGLLDDVTLQNVLTWRESSKPGRAWGVRYHPEYNTAMAYLELSTLARDAHIHEEEERERLKLETARAFADKQQRAARRMRWLTAGMAVMFVLAFAAAVWGFDAQRTAIRLKNEAEQSAKRAREAQTGALLSAKEAQAAQAKAEKSAQDAQREKDNAEKSAQAAEQEKAKADKSAQAAKEAQAKAEKSKKEVEESNARLTTEKNNTTYALDRSTWNVLGGAAFQREDYSTALRAFGSALITLDREQERPRANANTENSLGYARVSLLSNLGATLLKIGESDKSKLPEAVASYECAKSIMLPDKASAEFCRVAEKVALKQNDDEAVRQKAETQPAGQSAVSDWALFDLYYGAAHAYRDWATSLREEFYHNLRERRESAGNLHEQSNSLSSPAPLSEVSRSFKKSEEYFQGALEIQERRLEKSDRRIAGGYQELAHGYLDSGQLELAETAFKRAVELLRLDKDSSALDSNNRAALAAALKELGEFYQWKQGRYDDALKVFNEMVTLQEDVTVNELAGQGQEIANTYNDLGQIYSAMGDKQRAENAYRAANLLQQTALKLRRVKTNQRTPTDPEWLKLIRELTIDLDALGDAYTKLDKFPDAEAIYLTSLQYREGQPEERTSYSKLRSFYLQRKDYANAEKYNQLLLTFYKDKPRSPEYAGALVLMAALYAEAPDRSADARSNYQSALEIYKERRDWWNENLVFYRLARLFEREKMLPEQEQALRDRVDTLAGYFNLLATPAGPQPKDPVTLVSEYLYAIQALASFYEGKDVARAEAAYQRAVAAYDYITRKIYNEDILKFYAARLGEYQKLLVKLNKQLEAVAVADKHKIVKDKLRQFEVIREQEIVQRTQQSSWQLISPR
ncbi:MAG TPA: tetratricopeptide repeat protein [Pyrinomonadaceae bacterium]|nr:tetratricopeptide repeat protein [Pyrinomonadaceae bacterium]